MRIGITANAEGDRCAGLPLPALDIVLLRPSFEARVGHSPPDLGAVPIVIRFGSTTSHARLDVPDVLLPTLFSGNRKVCCPVTTAVGSLPAIGTATLIADPHLDLGSSIRGAGDGVGSGIHHGDRQVGDDVGLGAVAIADRDCLSGLEIEATEVQVKVAPLVGVSSSVVAIYRDVHRAVGLPFPA